MGKKKMTPNQAAYQKELKRIQNYIAKKSKVDEFGGRFEFDLAKVESLLPRPRSQRKRDPLAVGPGSDTAKLFRPDRVTARMLKDIRELRGNRLLSQSQYVSEVEDEYGKKSEQRTDWYAASINIRETRKFLHYDEDVQLVEKLKHELKEIDKSAMHTKAGTWGNFWIYVKFQDAKQFRSLINFAVRYYGGGKKAKQIVGMNIKKNQKQIIDLYTKRIWGESDRSHNYETFWSATAYLIEEPAEDPETKERMEKQAKKIDAFVDRGDTGFYERFKRDYRKYYGVKDGPYYTSDEADRRDYFNHLYEDE